jgi:hypothetical protein
MKKIEFTDLSRRRVANWMMQAKPLEKGDTWKEKRLVVDFEGCTYMITADQVFQCVRCGHYDPQWSITEVLAFFEIMGIKPYEVEITCTFTN